MREERGEVAVEGGTVRLGQGSSAHTRQGSYLTFWEGTERYLEVVNHLLRSL